MDKIKDRTKLRIKIESKTSGIPEHLSSGKTLSYLDMTNSPDRWAHSIISIAESKDKNPRICSEVLSTVKSSFNAGVFSQPPADITESEFFHARVSGVFTEINSKLISMRNQGKSAEASLSVALQRKNTLYISIAGNINALLIRNSILYNLLSGDSIFSPIKVNPYKKNMNFVNLGTTIIPLVNTYKLQLEPGDIVVFTSSALSEVMKDREILLNFCMSENFDDNFNNLLEKAVGRNPGRNITMVSLLAEPIEQSDKLASSSSRPSAALSLSSDRSLLAELPPVYPPSMENSGEIELYRDKNDFYNASNGGESREIEQEEKSDFHAAEPSGLLKVVVGILALLVTVSAGFLIMSGHTYFSEPIYNTNWSLSSSVKSSVIWNRMPSENIDSNNPIKFNYRSDKQGELEIIPEDIFYDCDLTVYTGRPISVQSEQSFGSVSESKIIFQKDKIYIHTNLCTTMHRGVISEESRDSEGIIYYKMSLKLNKVKGPLRIMSEPMRTLREINLRLYPSDK